jgi:hypothetical protein
MGLQRLHVITGFLLGLLLHPQANAVGMFCRAVYAPSSKISTIEIQQFHQEMNSIDENLKALKLNSIDLVPEKALGYGHYSGVVQVHYQGHSYALKLVRQIMPYDGYIKDVDKSIRREGVIIQRMLGKLGWAPELIGILDSSQIGQYTKKYESELAGKLLEITPDEIDIGILMELSNPATFKTKSEFGKMALTPAQKEKLKAQAHGLFEIFNQLGILPNDIDGTIVGNDRLMLIDIGSYAYPWPHAAPEASGSLRIMAKRDSLFWLIENSDKP